MTTETTEEFRFRDIAVVAYAPSIVSALGHGAVMPILALRATDLGADASMAAFVVALLGIGSLATSLPAGSLVARIGERRTLMGAGALDAVAMTVAFLSTSVIVLAVAVFVSGMSWTAFLIARQGFLIDATPPSHRARAMALLGGSFRIGVFVGPLIGAGLIHLFGLSSIFLLAAAMSLCSAAVGGWMPDFGRSRTREQGHLSVRSVLWAHRRTFATLGVAVVIIGISRSVRIGLLPLWADHIHLNASVVSLLFAGAALVDIALTLPGGWLLDHRGRQVVAIPVVVTVGVGCLLLPLTHDALTLGAVMALIALGNGLGSGIVMTMGADAAPADGRAQFLGGWRLCGDLGGTGGPLLVSGLAAVLSIAAAPVALGIFSLVGAVWVGHWTGRADRARLAGR
ncbi:putative MFS family arabinose efflux permease [Nocardioides albertanoniae]|uniref:Putative MFS family arabinose efflux permease n=1 Tax=Nocardioides albertanoniae TaxID=1175486 RepID=A0A543AD44_9ACTN|nr:MFS transporter [Nocardioides albertanoniae]TQL70505.1 putative MFS family arabinose efflux permease [Nocardioides albertanoniae]